MTSPPARQTQGLARLTPLTLAVALLAGGLWALVDLEPFPSGLSPVWMTGLLLVGFVLADVSQVHVEVRRLTVSLSLSELPLVIGLFLVDPLSLLVARLLGSLAVEASRRAAGPKMAFNLALFCSEVATATLLFMAIAGADRVEPRSWLAAYVATLGAALLTGTLVCLAITRIQGPMPRRDIALMLAPLMVGSQLSTTGALLAVVTVHDDERAIVLLVALLLLSLGAYRAYSTLLRRHRSLGQMRDFTAAMSAGGTAEQLASQALRHARALLSASEAVLVLDGTGHRPPSALVQHADTEEVCERRRDAVTDRVRAEGAGVLLPRGTKEPDLARWLREQGLRDAVVVPLLGVDGVVGTLQVGQRLGETGTFGDADRQLLQMVAVHLEIALRSGDLLDELRYEATHDSLTGLPNRTLFQERVSAVIAASPPGERFAVLLLDLDGFKDVNDTLGHHSGDILLRAVAARLVDSTPDAVTVARLGGDEFALLVPAGEDRAGVEAVAVHLQGALRQPLLIDGVELETRASVGVALCPEHGASGPLLLRRADIAMYAAKESRLPVSVYDVETDRSNPRRLAMVSELRTAIERSQLVCHYQPKVSVGDGTLIGVEALVRWVHPVHGLVGPDDFVPIAERTGLIVGMTSFVLGTALRDCARWRGAGRELSVAVNVSPRGLLAPHFTSEVAEALLSTGVPPRALTLEITESSIMTNPVKALAVLVELHELGVQLSVDDFGTGYSSLTYLQRLPVDEVKIDQSFVRDLATNSGNVAIVRAIVDLGHTLGLRVVAEGVEDQCSLERLDQLGCDSAQGYLISRPLALDVFEGWMAQAAGRLLGPAPVLPASRAIALP